MKQLLLVSLLLARASALPQAGSGAVTGEIHFNDGAPAAGVRVSVMIAPDSSVETTGLTILARIGETDSSGRYRLSDIPPGRYYIVAGTLNAPIYYPGTSEAAKARIFTIESGSNTDVAAFAVPVPSTEPVRPARGAIPSAPFPFVSGIVVLEGGRPLPILRKLYVFAGGANRPRFTPDGGRIRGSGTFGAIPVGPDGRFRLDLLNGEYTLSLINGLGEPLSATDGYYVKSIFYGATDLLKEKLRINGPTSNSITITLAPVQPGK